MESSRMPSQDELEQMQPAPVAAPPLSPEVDQVTRTIQALEAVAAQQVAANAAAREATPPPGHAIDVGHQPADLPPWLIDADAEERRELEELGVVVAPTFAADAERDALISRLMRAHHEHDADVERYDAAEAIEHQTIMARYDRLRAPAKRQMARLGSFIAHLVSTVTFTGKKKSRSVGWGSYGHRKQPDKVEITDALALVAAVKAIRPAAVKVEVVTNALVVEEVDLLITGLIANGEGALAMLNGSAISLLSELRAQLRAGTATVSKTTVGALLKEDVHAIPGATVTIGTDKSWFEVEAPPHV